MILHCHGWEFWSRDMYILNDNYTINYTIKNEKLLNSNDNKSKPKLSDFCVFAEYDLFKPSIFIQNFYICIIFFNLTQFYINFSKQEHQIELLWVLINS